MMSFRRSTCACLLLVAACFAAGCGRRAEGEQLGREYAEYVAPKADDPRRTDLAAHFARGYVDRMQAGPTPAPVASRQVPAEGASWSEEDQQAYWSGYLRGGSILADEAAASGRRGRVLLEAAGLTAIVAGPFWWMRQRARRGREKAR
jgi:hypothetical protein